MRATTYSDQAVGLGGGVSASGAYRIRVVVIDDHATIGELLALALDGQADVECVGQATTAAAGMAMVARERPDVVLMDYGLPDMDGVQATRRLRTLFPHLRIVMLTAATDRRLVAQATAAGAAALVSKTGGLAEVLQAIRSAHARPVDAADDFLAEVLTDPEPATVRTAGPQLTPRELEVLQLLATGADVRKVAQRLGISMHTCRGHVKSLLAKLDCHSQLEAVVAATRLGLIEVSAAT